MTGNRIDKFEKDRESLNETVMKYAGLNLKRFYSLDGQVYHDGALPTKTKELLGLIASFVLRCDDCILYHLIQCQKNNISDDELEETLTIGLAVGGSITIPHLRRAMQAWDEMKEQNNNKR